MAKENTKKYDDFEYEYDPIKEQKDGKAAAAVIWSTKSLNKAIEGIKKGLPLKANPFIGKNTKLLKPDLVFKRTDEEIADYARCMQDPIYFASKCYLMTPTGLRPVELRDYQIDYINHLKENRFSIFLSCRQSGKTLTFINNITSSLLKRYKTIYTSILRKYQYYIDNDRYIITLPLFELQNLFDDSFIWKLKYPLYKILYKFEKLKYIILTLISLIDFIDYKFIKKKKLLDGYKTINDIDISDAGIEILSDTGFHPISHIYNTKPFIIYKIKLENGYEVEAADKHIFYDENMEYIYADALKIGDKLITDKGPKSVVSISKINIPVSMCDTTVEDDNHRFYANGVLSHNSTTTAIFALWSILFRIDRNALILSKSGPAGRDLIKKIKDMYLYLPYHLKCGTLKWNQSEIAFDNNSTISTEAFSPTAGLGKTINFLILDEFAWCPPNDVELFYQNVLPTITTDTSSNVCIMSTQNGFNLFYKLWHGAEIKENIYAPFKVDWWQVPNWDSEHQCWVKRDEKWKQMMIGVLGSEEAFYYQYGTQFSASDKCLVSRECLGDIRTDAKLFLQLQDDTPYITQVAKYWSFKIGYDISKMKNRYYVILVDLAEGGGGDYTIFNIIEVKDKDKYEQIGYWRSNQVDLKHAALEFWLMYSQLFDPTKALVSIEWNTYGALFYTYLTQLNEDTFMEETFWRFNFVKEFDTDCIIRYKKGNQEEIIAMPGMMKNAKNIPGIRFSSGNKKVACALLKMMIEKKIIIITDLVTVSELENFEDLNGSGSYKASYGHDDLIMTFCQIPMLENTGKFKDLIEDLTENKEKLKYMIAQKLAEVLPESLVPKSILPSLPANNEITSRFTGARKLTLEDMRNI